MNEHPGYEVACSLHSLGYAANQYNFWILNFAVLLRSTPMYKGGLSILSEPVVTNIKMEYEEIQYGLTIVANFVVECRKDS